MPRPSPRYLAESDSSTPSAPPTHSAPANAQARTIGIGHHSVRGTVQVKGTSIAHENTLERDFLTILDFLPSAQRVRGQPVTITFRDPMTNKSRQYTPDVAVEFVGPSTAQPSDAAATPIIYEVKYRADLFAQWSRLKPAFLAARAHAREHGATFKILTEAEIRTPLLANVTFLRPYLKRAEHDGFEETLIATLMAYEEATPEIVLLASFSDEHSRLQALSHLWRLLAQGRIEADLTLDLTMKTPIWVAEDEATTWSDPHSYALRPLVRSAAERQRIASPMRSISTTS